MGVRAKVRKAAAEGVRTAWGEIRPKIDTLIESLKGDVDERLEVLKSFLTVIKNTMENVILPGVNLISNEWLMESEEWRSRIDNINIFLNETKSSVEGLVVDANTSIDTKFSELKGLHNETLSIALQFVGESRQWRSQFSASKSQLDSLSDYAASSLDSLLSTAKESFKESMLCSSMFTFVCSSIEKISTRNGKKHIGSIVNMFMFGMLMAYSDSYTLYNLGVSQLLQMLTKSSLMKYGFSDQFSSLISQGCRFGYLFSSSPVSGICSFFGGMVGNEVGERAAEAVMTAYDYTVKQKLS